jgi:hypothetical protein
MVTNIFKTLLKNKKSTFIDSGLHERGAWAARDECARKATTSGVDQGQGGGEEAVSGDRVEEDDGGGERGRQWWQR